MSFNILLDMNISPDWVSLIQSRGCKCQHWSKIGIPNEKDTSIMQWAVENNYIVFTHDLDFGTALALTHAKGPSVIQIRTDDVLSETLLDKFVQILQNYKDELKSGAILVLDENTLRVRLLPIL